MSPNARDRARQKIREAKRQSVLDQRAAEARRNKQVIGVVMAMVLVIGGFVSLSLFLKKDDKPAAIRQTSIEVSRPTSSVPTTAAKPAKPVAGCVTPPPIPTDTRAGTKPDMATAAGKTFIATVTTSCGVVKMELDGAKAPQTVASFVSLAKNGYFANSPCHRLTTSGIFVLQCGDPTGTGGGEPGYKFGVENAPADSQFPPGTLAMARGETPDTNGGQFFIVYKQTVLDNPDGYSIFGRVTSGMGIVNRVAAAGAISEASGNTAPVQPISILKVDVTEKKA